ncbi:MAG: cysteine desulfurase [Treponema sp.]|nr:cysteine desulfurase [Treponema sp.]
MNQTEIKKEHYFDWAATAPQDTEILQEALKFASIHWGNPSSIHAAGTDAHSALTECRKRCAAMLGVSEQTVFFTSGGTESDHIPLLSVLTRPQKGSVLLSAIEHPALREMAKMLLNCGWNVITVKPDKSGFISADEIISKLQEDTVFVSVMAVNNETGAIQPIYEIADALIEFGKGKRKPFFHVDCVQAAGKIPLNLSYKGIDSAAFSAHKISGPRGIGILYLSKEITSFLRGGGQEKNIRSGTENLFGAAAFASCLEKYYICNKNPKMQERFDLQNEYTDSFIESLKSIPGCVLIPHERGNISHDKFSPWVVQAAFPGIPGRVMERALSAEGFYISTGSACSAGHHARPILDSMNISAAEKESAVRFSFGEATTKEAMDNLIEAVRTVNLKFMH